MLTKVSQIQTAVALFMLIIRERQQKLDWKQSKEEEILLGIQHSRFLRNTHTALSLMRRLKFSEWENQRNGHFLQTTLTKH